MKKIEMEDTECASYIASLDIAIGLCEKNIFSLRAGDMLRELREALMEEYARVKTFKGE